MYETALVYDGHYLQNDILYVESICCKLLACIEATTYLGLVVIC